MENKNKTMEEENQQTTSNINGLQPEQGNLDSQKSELEHQIERKNNEASETQIQMEKLDDEVTAKIPHYQRILKEREDSFNELHANYERLEDRYQGSVDKLQIAEEKIKEMTEERQQSKGHVKGLQQKVDSLRNHKSTFEDQIGFDELHANYKKLIDRCQESFEKLQTAENRIEEMTEERQQSEAQVNGLQLELDSLRNQKSTLEDQIGFDELHANYEQLEYRCQESFEKLQIAEMRIEEMTKERQQSEAQVNGLQLEVDSLHNHKSTLEDQIGTKNNGASDALVQMQNLNHELTSKISVLQKMLEDQEQNSSELRANYALLSCQFQESQEKLRVAENKLEEMVDENHDIVESKDERIQKMQMVSELNEQVVETAGEEIGRLRVEVSKLEENCKELREKLGLVEGEKTEISKEKKVLQRLKDEKIGILQKTEEKQKEEISRLEVLLRLSNRKLRITETEFSEKEENYLKMRQKLHDEYKLLEAHTLKSSETTGLLEKERIEIKEVAKSAMEILNSGLCDLEKMAHKLDEKHNSMLTRLSTWSRELQMMKHCAAAVISEKKDIKKEMQDLSEKVRILQMMVGEKEAMILDREEEKKEAIRQLCLWIEYHRENHNHLQKLLLAMRRRNLQAT